MKSKKKSFLFIEILLSLFLLIEGAFLVMKQTNSSFRKEIQNLESIECERIAENAFATVLEKFYTKQIPWDDLSKNIEQKLPDIPLTIGSLSSKPLHIHYQISTKKEQKKNDVLYKLLKIDIFLSSPQVFFKKNASAHKARFSFYATVKK